MPTPLPAVRALAAVPPDDATLVARAVGGSSAAFAAIYRRHHRYVAGVAYRVFGDDAELEDTVQEVFLEAHRCMHSIQDPQRLRAWLVTIAVRRVQKRIGKRVRRRRLADAVFISGPSCGDSRNEQPVRALYQALGQIPEKIRVPWMLRNIEGYALAEVAQMCDSSIATVKRRISKAQQRIDRRIGPDTFAASNTSPSRLNPQQESPRHG